MRKTKLGTKRQCQACGGRLYDLGKRPVVCPHCGAEVDLERVKRARARSNGEPTAAELESRRGAPDARERRGQGARAAGAAGRDARATAGPPPQWSPEQAEALDKVGRWLAAGEPQVFRLFGYAGVGKTTLAKRLAESASGETAFAAFTGKAALVMRSKGCVGASTIHALDLSRQRGRRRRADLHPQPRRPRLARRADRHRRMLDGRRRARPRPAVVRQADPGARRPGAIAAGQGRRLLHRGRARRDADDDPSPGAGRSDHPPVRDRPLGRRDRLRPIWRQPRHPPRRDRRRRRARRRSGPARRQSHPPPLQSAHPATAGDRRSRCRSPATSSSVCATTASRA